MRNALRSSLRAQNGQANFSSPLLFFFASQDMEKHLYAIGDDSLEAFAPVVARLAGK